MKRGRKLLAQEEDEHQQPSSFRFTTRTYNLPSGTNERRKRRAKSMHALAGLCRAHHTKSREIPKSNSTIKVTRKARQKRHRKQAEGKLTA